ncbi:fucosyltransferase 2-like isoform X1 [Senna tora]|uniref:Fucosyltransferase n=1 Tax=Senna tora TaxID=362788 RepID=A0A834XEM0_9FABA|nr:fucosyltransferase 2-like isoform X1 [Senna tora]
MVVIGVVFPAIVMITLMYQNSIFNLFEGFSKDKVLGIGTTPHNVTTMDLGFRTRLNNTSNQKENKTFSEGITNNSTNDSTPLIKINAQNLHLDGLLASGFDEASCISRFQSYLYRKASPHKPSSYLISKLRNYEEIHRKCGPRTRSYNTTMRNLVRSKEKHHSTNTSCKYIVWTPVNGLGNRMISMAATFLYSLLTDRVLLVKFEDDMMGLFCEPFLNSTWEFPKDSPFWDPTHVETYQRMMEKEKNKSSLPLVVHLNFRHTQGDPEKFFHCDQSQKLVQKVPFLILQTDQYFVPSLFMAPSFSSDITQMFPEKDTVFHHLGRYLFHPSNQAWGLISRFYQAYMEKSDQKIGLQIRLFSPDSTPHQAVLDLLLSCALQHKLLPELDTENPVTSTRRSTTLKAVLVASLFPEYGDSLRNMYVTRPTITGEVVGVYQPSHEEHQKFHNNMHNMKAWTEMYLLSLCDELVTTSLSTFGYVAQGLGGLKPWLLYRIVGGDETQHDPPCVRDFSMEPCHHIPPKHDCEGKASTDFITTSFPFIRPCMDYSFGVKMANVSV